MKGNRSGPPGRPVRSGLIPHPLRVPVPPAADGRSGVDPTVVSSTAIWKQMPEFRRIRWLARHEAPLTEGVSCKESRGQPWAFAGFRRALPALSTGKMSRVAGLATKWRLVTRLLGLGLPGRVRR